MFEPLTIAIAVAVLVAFVPAKKDRSAVRRKKFIQLNAYAYAAAQRDPKWDERGKDISRRSGAHRKSCRYRKRPVVNKGDCTCPNMQHWNMTFARAIKQDLDTTTESYSAKELKAFRKHYEEALILEAVRKRTLTSTRKFSADLEKEELQHAKNIENLRVSNPDPELAEFNRLLAEA